MLNALALCEILTVPAFWYHGSSLLYLSLSSHSLSHNARFVSAEVVRDGAALGLAEMVRGGTTCVNDMYFFNDALLVAARAAGAGAPPIRRRKGEVGPVGVVGGGGGAGGCGAGR